MVKDIQRQFWTGLLKSYYNKLTSQSVRLSGNRATRVTNNRPQIKALGRKASKYLSFKRAVIYFKSFQLRWYHFIIAILVTLLLSPHARAIQSTTTSIKPGAISTQRPLKQPVLKPQAQLTAVPPAPPPAPVIIQGGCGSDPYMAQIYMHESGCRVDAVNPSNGAYGLCQSLPGYKMATVGGDWATSWATQNAWCIGYADARYGSPAGAWAAWQVQGWW